MNLHWRPYHILRVRGMSNFPEARSPYQMINLLAGSVIVLIFIYSFIVQPQSSNHTLECIHVSTYGEECRSCGLTRSFAAMARGDFSAAAALNRSGPLIFLFFASQLFMRVFFGIMVHRSEKVAGRNTGPGGFSAVRQKDQGIKGSGWGRAGVNINKLATADGALSATLFLICFRYLLFFWH